MLHTRFAAPKRWLAYVDSVVGKGLMLAHPPATSNEGWGRIQRYLNGHDFTWTPAPTTFVQSGFLAGLLLTAVADPVTLAESEAANHARPG
jgi:hypothetical protein